jgi:hypothetical protein
MSRSYHVTKRAAVRAFILDGDKDLTAEASDKAGIKRRERVQRGRQALGLKRQPNHRAVAAERELTRAVLRRRGEGKGAVIIREDSMPNQSPQPTPGVDSAAQRASLAQRGCVERYL